jgi:hypothetical protein
VVPGHVGAKSRRELERRIERDAALRAIRNRNY